MNILFVNLFEPTLGLGGIGGVTSILAKEMQIRLNYNCYSLWCNKDSHDLEKTVFVKSCQIKENTPEWLKKQIIEWNINAVIIQAYNDTVVNIRKAIQLSGKGIKMLYVLHSTPGWEYDISRWDNVKRMVSSKSVRDMVKMAIFPFFRLYHTSKVYRTYQRIYKDCDRLVLLSDSFIPQYCKKFGIENNEKLMAIPNLSQYLDDNYSPMVPEKKKRVLIVSRLSEFPKKISLALDIWRKIEGDKDCDEWSLDIVGEGSDRKLYEKLIEDYDLKRVRLLGRQKPDEYYSMSALFMMTSMFEGFGLTLVESQSYGCVPIVFDTFSALHDIITSGENGIIVPYPAIDDFYKNIKCLMLDDSLRNKMANNCVKDCVQFSIPNIIQKWKVLLES